MFSELAHPYQFCTNRWSLMNSTLPYKFKTLWVFSERILFWMFSSDMALITLNSDEYLLFFRLVVLLFWFPAVFSTFPGRVPFRRWPSQFIALRRLALITVAVLLSPANFSSLLRCPQTDHPLCGHESFCWTPKLWTPSTWRAMWCEHP